MEDGLFDKTPNCRRKAAEETLDFQFQKNFYTIGFRKALNLRAATLTLPPKAKPKAGLALPQGNGHLKELTERLFCPLSAIPTLPRHQKPATSHPRRQGKAFKC